jgi:hypothetical protein
MDHIWTMPREYCGRRSSFIAAHAQTVTATVPVGTNPFDIAVNPVTNKIYVTNPGGAPIGIGTVTVIDGATNKATGVALAEVYEVSSGAPDWRTSPPGPSWERAPISSSPAS